MTETELINFGVLNGWLKSIARVNDKTNNGHELQIIRHENSMSIHEFCNLVFSNLAEEIEIKEETSFKPMLETIFNFWFYQYQSNNPLKEYFLKDENNNFSLSDDEWKKEWVEEFVDLLVTTLKPTKAYRINLKRIKRYYCNVSDDIILVGKNHYFRIHCCLTD